MYTKNSKLFILIILPILLTCYLQNEKYLIEYVDPFIGTGGHGHTYPGAAVPFGMIQLSPDNPSQGWDWTSGYHYSDSILLGFSHTHLSGTGVGDLLDILVMPFVTEYPSNTKNKYNRVYSKYTHEDEIARPGYYSVDLKNEEILAELTVTERVGYHKYSFYNHKKGKILIDLGYAQNWDRTVDSKIEIIDDYNIAGYRLSSGWAKNQPLYFAAEFSTPFTYKLFSDSLEIEGNRVTGTSSKVVLSFDLENNQTVMIKLSLSSASIEGAIKNLNTEVQEWDFEKVKKDAAEKWENELSKIKVDSDDIKSKKIFYTALYHSMLAPTIFDDLNEQYYGTDSVVHKSKDYNKYTLFSLWDTFRALHPLLTIIKPSIVDDFVKSMISFYDESGLLPTWDLQNNETDVMIGYHAVPVIYDAYKKRLTNVNPKKMFEAMKKSALQDTFGLKHFRKYGYIPSELEREAVSKTLEYCYDDWCIAQMAKEIGAEDEYEYFIDRSKYYKNLFDKRINFMRGKDKDGNWIEEFNPIHVSHRRSDYTEANAWQYTWHVMHDVDELIELFGGKESFIGKLDSLFIVDSKLEGDVSPDISGLIGQYAHGNEPCHHIPYLYSAAGHINKAAFRINQIRKLMYTDKPDGLIGNDDCGQMSAWYVFSALGFYPLNPADGKYWFGTPKFENVEINLHEGKRFEILSENLSDKNIYINSAELNGSKLDRNYITHGEIINGGVLIFKMGDIN